MAGLQLDVYTSIFITMGAASTALILRLMARRMTKVPLWYDDYFAVVAFMFAVAYCTAVTVCTRHYGLGQTIDITSTPTAEQTLERSRLTLWIGSLTYASSIASSKISFLAFYWRLFQFSSIRIAIQILAVTSALWYIVRTFLTVFQCIPVRAIWDKNIPGGTHCPVDQPKFFFGSVLVHFLMDVVILLLPVFPISRMRMTLRKKVGVVCLFSSGAVVCVASVFVLIESITFQPDPNQITSRLARNWFWAAVEVNMAVFSGSLPMLRPIIRKLCPSCMAGSSDDEPSYEGGTAGIRFSRRLSNVRRVTDCPASSTRRLAGPTKMKSNDNRNASWTGSDQRYTSEPATGAARGITDEDHDSENDYGIDDHGRGPKGRLRQALEPRGVGPQRDDDGRRQTTTIPV